MSAYKYPIFLFVLGAALFAYGSTFPEYSDPRSEELLSDPKWNEQIDKAFREHAGFDELADRWYALKDKLETCRHRLLDFGSGLIALGLSMSLLFLISGARDAEGLLVLRSPKTIGGFYLLTAITWLSFFPAEFVFYTYTCDRGDYPGFADSVAIPLFGELIFAVLGLPVVLIGVWVAIHGKRLPVNLWSRSIVRNLNIICLPIVIASGLAIMVLAIGVVSRPPIVPSAVFTLYLLLSGLSIAAQPWREPFEL